MGVEHLYVHIPFCRSRCAYCDFSSEVLSPVEGSGKAEAYLQRLRSELSYVAPILARPVETIYVGGGTPTVLPLPLLVDLVGELAGLLPASGPEGNAPFPGEFTIEANPGTVDAALLRELRRAGVTRLSVGVQSFSPRLRKSLGRGVSQSELDRCLRDVHEVDWEEWNLDLIHGIPGQTWEEAAADIDRAVEAGPTHISLYDLTYTPAYRGRVVAAMGPEALERAPVFAERHYGQACTRLIAAGYERYEVSNFALPGHECRHNSAYWAARDYVGLGASAVSTVGGERRSNPCSVTDYLTGEPPETERLSRHTRLWEKAMLGLRTAAGVDQAEVAEVIDAEALERLMEGGYVWGRCGKLRLNPGFLDLSNSIISALLTSPEEP